MPVRVTLLATRSIGVCVMLRSRACFVALFSTVLLTACGGGSGPMVTPPVTDGGGTAPAALTRIVQLGSQPTLAVIPPVADITGTIAFPAVPTPTTLELGSSTIALTSTQPLDLRRMQSSGTLTIYEYVTMTPKKTVSLPNIPAFSLTLPASTPVTGKTFRYGYSDPDSQGGTISFDTQGPATVNGQTVAFAAVPTPLVLNAGKTYTFVVYATAATAPTIYVSINDGLDYKTVVATYNSDGTPTTPTMTTFPFIPGYLATDRGGRIYAVNFGQGSASPGEISIFDANGTLVGSDDCSFPAGVAVDGSGTAYASCSVTNPIGSPFGVVNRYSGSTIDSLITGIHPGALAVNAGGSRIYVQIGTAIQTYTANGAPTSPTISHLDGMTDVTVDAAGKIYVAIGASTGTNGSIRTFTPGGVRTTPTITAGIRDPIGIAVDATGKIFVANAGSSSVTTYTAAGLQTSPTISGIKAINGIAVH
jgi:hypothetical protein